MKPATAAPINMPTTIPPMSPKVLVTFLSHGLNPYPLSYWNESLICSNVGRNFSKSGSAD
jgi:hypothetical protein